MTKIRIKEGESLDKALRRLKKKIDKEGITKEMRKHAHYEKPSQRKRRKMLKSKKQNQGQR